MEQSKNYSPLRYPGGKSKLYNLVSAVISQYDEEVDTYAEPFAGGAGIAMGLLLNHQMEKVIINDINIGIYSFWDSICNNTEDFLRLVKNTDVNIETYNIQKIIYQTEKQKSLELGFATFFLNRTCFSGVLGAGPIGGYAQTGKYLVNARYNTADLMKKIEQIARLSSKIEIYNLDVVDFIKRIIRKEDKVFTYFDPPYFVKGKALYTNFLEKEDHEKIYKIISKLKTPWLITYDNVNAISEIYKKYNQFEFNLSYTVNPKVCRKGTELLMLSDISKIDNLNQEICEKINLKNKRVSI